MASDDGNTKATVCKTISCLLPTDLEVKRACQLTEFLLEPTVDAYYAVETLYNEPDQKLEEENMPVPNSLRCELLLVFKTQWPFDPEFWDWRTLKRQCLALMGEEASIVSSIDLLNDNEEPEEEEDIFSQEGFNSVPEHNISGTYELSDITDKRQKIREMKKLREKGFISARFRNWQAYMQYCVLCDKEFLGHRIVRHANTHFCNGVYSCPICAQTFTSKDTMIPHVKSHVNQSCKERLTALKTNKRLTSPKIAAPVTKALKAKTENELKNKAISQGKNCVSIPDVEIRVTRCDADTTDDNVCPVGKCRRTFKFLKNLVAHVKGHGDDEEAKTFLEMQSKKVVCQYCRRHFVSVTHLNDHLQVHCGVKPYICIQLNCDASFLSNTDLLLHRKTHPVFRAKCMFPNCGKIFSEAFKLYDHEAHHYKTFTCKVVDCGKVFHSLKQLDLHQEKHASHQEDSPSSEQKAQHEKPSHSLIEQMLSNHTPVGPECSQEKRNTECATNPDNERLPATNDSLLKSSQIPVDTFGQCKVKTELQNAPLPTSQAQSLINSVIQPMNPTLSDANRHREGLGDHSFDYTRPPHPHNCDSDMSQPQPQMFHTNITTGSTAYNSECNLTLSGHQEPVCSSSLPPVVPLQNTTGPAISQLLPATVTQQPLTPVRPENSLTASAVQGPPPGQRERYHCAFEACTRHYCAYRSVIKHMKTVHPDFYEQWKVVRTQIKVTYAPALKAPSVGHHSSGGVLQNQQSGRAPVIGVQRQNVIKSPTYTNMATSTNYAPIHSHSTSAHNHNASLAMENVLNPIFLTQLGSDTNQDSQKWHSAHGSEQSQNCGPSQVYPSDMQVMPQVDSTSATLPLNVPFSMMGATMSSPEETLQSPLLGNGSQAVLPPYMAGTKEMTQQQYTSQMQSSLISGDISTVEIKSMQKHAQINFPSTDSANHKTNNQPQRVPGFPKNDPEYKKQAKRNKRTKWPAIVRNGKFLCCRCFREFNSPKSLGGHLSKRASCKPYDVSDLNTDLPTSFLDLLNSEQPVVPAQPPLSYNHTAVPHQPVINDTPPINLNYPQDNLLAYGNGESSGIIKQIKSDSTMSDLYAQTSPQPLFPNPCVSYGAAERLPGNSVIQHTENVQPKQQGTSYSPAHYPQPTVDAFAKSQFPDPLLSQILIENPPVSSINAKYKEQYHSEECNSEPSVRSRESDPNPAKQLQFTESQVSPSLSGKQVDTQGKTNENDIKKRLREQILSGDFQRRTSLIYSSNTDPSVNSKNPTPFGSVGGPSNNSEFQMSRDTNSTSENSAVVPETASGIQHLLSTQSFTCFRESCTIQQEVLSPTKITTGDADHEPSQLSASQQQWMAEIQGAFERLDLVTETSPQISAPMKPDNTAISQVAAAKIELPSSSTSNFVKPFTCENQNCTFSFMSGDALWKHLSKSHNYTLDMVNVVKKRYGQYAPFKCLKCSKTFTRNSNLRAHYHSLHKLSAKEIEELDVKRRQAKAAATAAVKSQAAAHSAVKSRPQPYSLQDAIKHYCPTQAFVPCSNIDRTNKKPRDVIHSTLFQHLQTAVPEANCPPPVNHQPATSRKQIAKPSIEIPRKTKEKKLSTSNTMSPYRPYRCVHQGCMAAFTIQHNLILHYRAVHQSALSALEANKDKDQSDGQDEGKSQDEEDTETEDSQFSEFRCQVKDCSRVFQEVPNLLQHYLQLHEFGMDKVGVLLSGIKPGKFTCGYQGCTAPFTTPWRYIGHVKEQHKDMFAKPEQLNGSFKCEMEGCDRSYATKSNMLRHFMKKHGELYRAKLKNQRIKNKMKQSSKVLHYQITKTGNGKENIENNRKIWQRSDTRRVSKVTNNHWTKYGKPSLKTKVEASSLCTKNFPLQYPCMIKGCESVMKSERNILKHYIGHGLSEKYLEQQRSHFIFCKKISRHRCHSIRSDDSKSDSDLSDGEMPAPDTSLEVEESGRSRPVLRKRTAVEIPAALFESKLSNDESSDGSLVVKRKRGRPRKLNDRMVKRRKIRRMTKIDIVCSQEDESDSSSPAVIQEKATEPSAPLAAFKPMGFEMSFLKFLEQSNKCEHSLTMKVDVPETFRNPSTQIDTCVHFRNQRNQKSLSKVKIIIDRAFSGVADFMLKQLQDMQPTVMLGKNDLC